MKVTEIREAVKTTLSEFGEVQVWIAPTEYGKTFGTTDEIKLSTKIIVGPADAPLIEEQIDELFEDVPKAISDNPTLGGIVADAFVASCTGHRLYSAGPNDPPVMGADWTIKIVTND